MRLVDGAVMRLATGVMLAVVLGAAMDARAQESGGAVARDSRVFEMRTYHAAAGRIDDLHARFRNHTSDIFRKHGMAIIGYWVPIDEKTGAIAGNTLVYILAYPSLEARQKAWDEFRADPEWNAVKTESEKNGKLVDKVDSVFLKSTDYSPVK